MFGGAAIFVTLSGGALITFVIRCYIFISLIGLIGFIADVSYKL
jgi:hypothetical protein